MGCELFFPLIGKWLAMIFAGSKTKIKVFMKCPLFFSFNFPYPFIRTNWDFEFKNTFVYVSQIFVSYQPFFFLARFISFNVEPHSRCLYDYLDVFDGNNTSAPKIGRYCGTHAPDVIKSSGNAMYINFVTDSSESGEGFQGAYWSTYGEMLLLELWRHGGREKLWQDHGKRDWIVLEHLTEIE